jgi:hypothetical protein
MDDHLHIESVSVGRWRGKMVREYLDSGLFELFRADEFPAPGFLGKVEAMASNIGVTWRIQMPGSGERTNESFIAKSFPAPSIKERVKNLLKPTGAARSWQATQICMKAGIPVPPPVALMEQSSMGVIGPSVFINLAIPDTLDQNLEYYFRNNYDLDPLPQELVREKHEIVRLIADMFRKAHDQDKIYFPDFHPHNMIVQKSGQGVRLYLVDFDEVRFKVRQNDRIKNLASLGRNADKINKRMSAPAITTGDRLRFIRDYLGKDVGAEEAEKLRKEIVSNWNLK